MFITVSDRGEVGVHEGYLSRTEARKREKQDAVRVTFFGRRSDLELFRPRTDVDFLRPSAAKLPMQLQIKFSDRIWRE